MSPYRSAGARWLSEDEGVDTSKKVNRYSDEEVLGRGLGKRGLGVGSTSTATGQTDPHSSPSQSNAHKAASGAETSTGSPVLGRSRLPSAGLLAAKAQWKAMENTGRRRLRRANSQEQAPESSTRTQEGSDRETNAPISGHPIASEEGVPMLSIRDIAPIGRTSGGISTYRSNPLVEEASIEPATVSRPISGSSTPSPMPVVVPSAHSSAGAASTTDIPDFATGRGGDGIGGHAMPSEAAQPEEDDGDERARIEFKKKMLPELKSILTCPVCVSEKGSLRTGHPFLQRPITLRCGHTICLSHVKLSNTPAPNLTGIPTSEAHIRLAAWNSSRLSAWANTSCPIPFCRQHSPSTSTAPAASGEVASGDSTAEPPTVSRQRRHSEHNGVAFYPSARPVEDGSAPDSDKNEVVRVDDRGAPFDFTISKVLSIILRELERERLSSFPSSMLPESSAIEVDADAEDSEDTSETTSDEAADSSFDTTPFAPSPKADPSFLPSGHTASRTRQSRQHDSGKAENTMLKRRRRSTADPNKSPFGTPPSNKRSVLTTRPPASAPRHNSYTFEKELASTLECDVCTSMFYEPITTPCGHTFCSRCLARSLDHSNRCPVCRHELPSFAFYQDHPVNKVLTSVVLTAFPEDLAERRRGIEDEERDARLDTPIFVCTLGFPGMPTILHVFEPRYRLMLRRCVESGRPRFGMVLPARGTGNPNVAGVMEYGTMLDIKSIQMLPDGRSMVEAVGSFRFRLLEKGTLDGYTVGRIERIDDISPEDEALLERLSLERARTIRSEARRATRIADTSNTPETGASPSGSPAATPQPTPPNARPTLSRALSTHNQPHGAASIGLPDLQPGEVEPSTEELMLTCKAFIDQLRSGSAPWLLQRLNNTYGPMPEDPSLFSFWMALVMPIDEYEKARLLPIRSTRLRLRLIAHWVEQLRSSWW